MHTRATDPMTRSADTSIDINASVMSRREALEAAHGHLTAVVHYCLDLDIAPDATDKEHIRKAYEMLNLALRDNITTPDY